MIVVGLCQLDCGECVQEFDLERLMMRHCRRLYRLSVPRLGSDCSKPALGLSVCTAP